MYVSRPGEGPASHLTHVQQHLEVDTAGRFEPVLELIPAGLLRLDAAEPA